MIMVWKCQLANVQKFCTCGGPKHGTVPSSKNPISAEIGFYWFKPKTFQTSFDEIGFLPPLDLLCVRISISSCYFLISSMHLMV